MIFPSFSFSCNGRLTGVKASTTIFVSCVNSSSYPFFQIWHPLSSNATIYNLTTEMQFPAPTCENFLRCNSKISLMENSSTEFHSGDLIGYYQPSPFCQIYNVNANDSISYNITSTSSANTFNISSANIDTLKPLFEVSFGKNLICNIYVCVCVHIVNACCTIHIYAATRPINISKYSIHLI